MDRPAARLFIRTGEPVVACRLPSNRSCGLTSSGRRHPGPWSHTPGTTTLTSAELQDLWFGRTAEAGWVFASDWHDPAIDALCEACIRGENLWPAAERLGCSTRRLRCLAGRDTGRRRRSHRCSAGAGHRSAAPRGVARLGRSDDGSATDSVRSADRPGLGRLPPDPDGRGLPRGRGGRHEGLRDPRTGRRPGRPDRPGGVGPDYPADFVRRCHAHRFRRRPDAGPPCRPYGGRAVPNARRCSPAGRNCSPAWSANDCPGAISIPPPGSGSSDCRIHCRPPST